MNIIPGTVTASPDQQTNANFTQEELDLQWMSMCIRMPQEYKGIATRMKNMNPTIEEIPHIKLIVDNMLIKQDIENFKGRILSTLRSSLQNSNITLDISVAEYKHEKILTRREQFELMLQKNPAVEALRQAFGLELA